jgi:hypothetical protein
MGIVVIMWNVRLLASLIRPPPLAGRVLTSVGVGPTLLVGPIVSLVGMACLGLMPSAATIAGEVA